MQLLGKNTQNTKQNYFLKKNFIYRCEYETDVIRKLNENVFVICFVSPVSKICGFSFITQTLFHVLFPARKKTAFF